MNVTASVTPIRLSDNDVKLITSTPVTMTTNYQDLGDTIDTRDCERIAIWLDVDINDSANVRVRLAALMTGTASVGWDLTASTVDYGYYEIEQDMDQKVLIIMDLKKAVPYVKIQACVGTAGVTAADIESVYVSRGR